MLWESLVTDGHVRAARLRRLQPWLIALGLILIWVGIWIARSGPDIRPATSFLGLLQERVGKVQSHAQQTVNRLPGVNLAPAAMQSLPPASELPELIQSIRSALTDNGKLPVAEIDFKELELDEFWKGEWGSEQVVYQYDDDTYLFGAHINAGSANYPRPGRWLGLMKKMASGWEYVTLMGNGLYAVANLPNAQPGQVPLSLSAFLPKPADEPAPAQE